MVLFAILCLSFDHIYIYNVNAFVRFLSFSIICSQKIYFSMPWITINRESCVSISHKTKKNPTQKALDSMYKHILSYKKLFLACRLSRLMANQIFSFNSYVLSELGHLDKLVDVSTDLIPEEKEWNSWSIFHVISCSYPKMMHSVAFAMEWLKRGNYRIRKMQPSCLSSKMLPTIFVIKYDIMTAFFSFFCPIENDW